MSPAGLTAGRSSIESNGPVDVACRGGIRILAVPICAGNEIVGSISVGYGDPPCDSAKLGELATDYGVSLEELRRQAEAYDRRPPFIIELAKRRILSSARLIGEIVARKQAEQTLRRREEKFRALFDLAKDVIFIYDQEGRILEANREACERLGYSRDEFLNMKPYEVDTPEEAALFPERITTLRKHGHHLFETVHQRRDGTVVPVEVSVRLFESGGKQLSLSVCRDITERKQVEAALRRSEEKFRSLVEATSDWVWEVDRTGAYTYTSPKSRDLLGYEPEEVLGRTPFDFMPPAERERVARVFQEAMQSKAPLNAVENTNIHKNGQQVDLETSAVPIVDADGNLLGYRGIDRDITERKRAEAALAESEKRFVVFMEHLPAGVFMKDQTRRLMFANRYLKDFFGWRECMGRTTEELLPPEVAEQMIAQDRKVLNEGPMVFQDRITDVHGAEHFFDIYKFPVEVEGFPALLAGIMVDITERKRMEEERRKLEDQMREVQKLESLGVLAGGIAHDFNNLLVAILGNADLALLSLSPVSPAWQYVEEITRASQRAADLCRQMLAYSGKGRFVVAHHDISEIVREMGQILSVSVSKKATIRYSLAEGLPAVKSDATQIRQVIMNLITNASDALGDMNGIITVTTGVMECTESYLSGSYLDESLPGGTYVSLEVSDTGCGMDAEIQSRIFDPFFTTKFIGRGLGLAAVLGIVRGHKGAIKVYSEVGQGTTIKILLPAAEWEPDKTVKTTEPTVSLQGGGTILLVDDDPVVRSVASAMLAQLGFQVLTAINGRDGLKVFHAHGAEIACVILDLTMPEMGGEEAFRELRNVQSDVRVILSSGYNEQEVTQRFVGRGLAGFIQKPYTMASLRSALTRVLG